MSSCVTPRSSSSDGLSGFAFSARFSTDITHSGSFPSAVAPNPVTAVLPGIAFATENVATRTENGYHILRSRLKTYLTDKGRSDNAAEGYLDRYGSEFHPHTAEEHIKLMEDAGFRDVEIFYYNYGQIGVYGFRR